MSVSVAALIAILAAVSTLLLEGVGTAVVSYVEKKFRLLLDYSSSHDSSDVIRSDCSSSQLSMGGLVVYQTDRVVFERIASSIEREVFLSERRQEFIDSVVVVVGSHQFLFGCGLVFALVLFSLFGSYGRRRTVSARTPNPRPILQRGGGTLARAGYPQ